MEQNKFIAGRDLYAVAADGRGFEVKLGVGQPYRITDDERACAAQLSGFHENLSHVHGIDSWQALQLAQQLAARLLGYFIQDGGRLFWEKDGEQVQLTELFANGPPPNNAGAAD
jgi:hypothetical protein